ncbi:MMPL family transporter [Acidocella sp.]|uniref:MMPL family transporter n=1 Tax=Acidocella sp. TaxID=50710 RepID=UPI0026337125|nr:MMPL family transporter [Acidocella sp.]
MKFTIAIVTMARRHAVLVILGFMALAVLGGRYTARHLSIDTDTSHLFAPNLPWRQAQIQQSRDFPQFDDVIVAVVRGKTPEEAQETAAALNVALNADKAHFHAATYQAGEPFYKQEGLLLPAPADLARRLGQIVAAQPFLGGLAADQSARGLFGEFGLIAQGVAAGADIAPYNTALAGLEENLRAAAAGHIEPLSWQALLLGNTGGAEFVIAHPVLNQASLQPGGVATAALRRIARGLPDVRAGRVTVDYTGQIPLSDEQFASLTHGLVLGGIISVIFIALWLFLALRSWRLIVPILLTLLLGLVLTVSFAAVTVKVMNLISVAFAILFIGLAVDFAIQYCVRLRDVRRHVPELAAALDETARQAGGQIALAATATACGFLAFAPTPFLGVAELGEIAGAGMCIAFFCTISALPALLMLFRPRAETVAVGLPGGAAADAWLRRHHRVVLAGFGVLALAGMAAATRIGFDANPLDTQDPNTEAMRTLRTMLDDPQTNPFYADMLVADLAAARRLTQKLNALPEIAGVISGATFIPAQQDVKLAMLAQARELLAPTLQEAAAPSGAPVSAADIRAAMAQAHAAIAKVAGRLPKDSPLLGIDAALVQLQGRSDAQLLALNAAITRFLPQALGQLATSLSPAPITRASLPPAIAADWFLPNGKVRVEALPSAAAQSTAGLRKFSAAVLSVAPDAGGPAISTIATASTILSSFREAASLAFIAIAVILFLVFRTWRESLLVLGTLALSALLTALFAWAARMSINYANIIALPLLLGVGVSFNVYFVMNFRAGMRRFLSSATAHAVLFSALTTATAFGTLAASADRGTASMGELLFLSLGAVLIATFVFLPALLYAMDRTHAGKA